MEWLETGLGYRPTGDGYTLAQGGIQDVLEVDLAASYSSGKKMREQEARELIFRMVVENPTSALPRIHGELMMLGFDLSERTVLR